MANTAPAAAADTSQPDGLEGREGPDNMTSVPDPAEDNPFLAALGISLGKRPRRVSPFHFYQRINYKATMVPIFTRRFKEAKIAYDEMSEKAQAETETPKAVKIRTELVKEFWNGENEEARARYATEAEEEYEREMEEWESVQTIPKTPLQYHQ